MALFEIILVVVLLAAMVAAMSRVQRKIPGLSPRARFGICVLATIIGTAAAASTLVYNDWDPMAKWALWHYSAVLLILGFIALVVRAAIQYR